MNFLVDQFDGATVTGVSGCGPGIVLLASAFHVLGDPGVKRAIGAPHDIHEPFVTGRSGLPFAVCSRHTDKIPGNCRSGCAAQSLHG
jgi:hypothetical protein